MEAPRLLQSLSVAVVGGGTAGLVAARELLREGHQVTVFEKGARCGGVWVYSDEVEEEDLLGRDPRRQRVHCSLYAGLRTNTTRENMGLSDFPFDYGFPGSADPCQFCSHEEVLRFLDAFVEEYGLGSVVQTRTEVVSVRPAVHCTKSGSGSLNSSNAGSIRDSANGCETPLELVTVAAAPAAPAAGGGVDGSLIARWEVTVQQLDDTGRAVAKQQVLLFDAVVICNGHFSEPQAPQDLPGQDVFPAGRQLHSHNYRRPEPFRGQTVVLVGAASSGGDIAEELAGVGARVCLCARRWENPLTGELLEVPTTTEPAKPGEVVKSANVQQLLPDGSVLLESGVVVPGVDAVIYCTGYRYSFPFLEGAGIVSVQDNRVDPLYRHVFPPAHAPWLSFVGIPFKVIPFPQFELQGKWIARALSGRAHLPSVQEMEAAIQRFYSEMEAQGVPVRYTHRQAGELQWEYNDWLASACGPDVVRGSSWRRAMYAATGVSRERHGTAYRDHPLPNAEVCEEEARQEAAAVRAQGQQQQPGDCR